MTFTVTPLMRLRTRGVTKCARNTAEIASSRGAVWSDEEVLALLSIWGDEKVQEELDGACSPKDKLHLLITANLYKLCNYSLMRDCVRMCVNTLNRF